MSIRISALIPILLSIVAFILSLLVILSGRNPQVLNDVFVLRVNTTDIGKNINVDDILSRVGVDPNQPVISTFTQKVQDAGIPIGEVLNTIAHEFGLHDLYSAHVLTWCEGTYLLDRTAKTTACTKPEIPFSFNPITILESELLQGMKLSDLGFPTDQVDNVVAALQIAYKAMSVCYLIGVILAGLSIVTGIVSLLHLSRAIELSNSIVVMLGMIALGIASGIGTAIAITVRNVFNSYAKDSVGVHAYSSGKYLALTWAAVAALLLASLVWCGICCFGRHHTVTTSSNKNTKYGYGEKERARRWSIRRKT